MPNVTFTFEIPAQEAERIAAAVCAVHEYDPAAGMTPVEFTRNVVFRWLAGTTMSYEARQAAELASNAVLTNPNDPLAQALLTEG